MRTYVCQICRQRFPAGPLGRLPRACPEHRKERNRRIDRERHKAVYSGLAEQLMPCCEDHRASGKRGRFCPQHRQFRKYLADHRRTPQERPGKTADLSKTYEKFDTEQGDEKPNRGFDIRRYDPSPDHLPPDYHPYFVSSKDSRI